MVVMNKKKDEAIFAIGVNYNTVYDGDNLNDVVGYGNGTIRDICLMSCSSDIGNSECVDEGVEFFLEYSGIEKAAQGLKSGVYRATFNWRSNDKLEEEFYDVEDIEFEPLYVLIAAGRVMMSIDPIYPKSSGMAGINRFDRFSLDELNMLMGVIRLFDPFLGIGDPSERHKKYAERENKMASELFGEIAQARAKNEQLAKPTSSVYPCPKCQKPGVYCGCSSSCRHEYTYAQRYCNHCEIYFSASSSSPKKQLAAGESDEMS